MLSGEVIKIAAHKQMKFRDYKQKRQRCRCLWCHALTQEWNYFILRNL